MAKLTAAQKEAIRQVFLEAGVDQYFDQAKSLDEYVETIREIIEEGLTGN